MITKKLKDLASVSISSVDKKSFEHELPVRLCNFTDVYYNWQLDNFDSFSFMKATATADEINQYSLKENDVCITKDSETRDDIGISCLIGQVLYNTILGYHCALIRPDTKLLDGGYLNCFLKTKTAQKYFSFRASGSGQRYTLSLENIENIEIPYIDLENQKIISQLFRNINEKIKLNNRINDNLSQLIDIIFKHYFLIDIKNQKGDFESILDYYDAYQPETISNTSFNNNFPYSVYGGGGFIGKYSKFNHDQPQVIISCRGSCGNTYFTSPYSWITGNAMVIKPKSDVLSKEYIFSYLKNIGVDKYLSGSVQKQLTKENLKNMEIYVPKYNDCLMFTTTVREYHEKIFKIREENEKLIKIRDFLLPLLLNGQVIIR